MLANVCVCWVHQVQVNHSLPALALGLPAGGLLGLLFSDGLAATLSERWLNTWSLAGISRWHCLLAVLRRTLPALLPQIGLVLVGLTGAAIAQDLPTLQCGILILLLIASSTGFLAQGAHYLLLGRVAPSLANSTPPQHSGKSSYVFAALAALLLCLLVLSGIIRDPLSSLHIRLQPPSAE